MSLALRDTQLHTYGDYLSWSDDTRHELIDGQAFVMSPVPDLSHPEIHELTGETRVNLLPEIVIHWDELVTHLPTYQY